MKILVAGSTGLVGKTLITDFLQEHEVIAISRRPFKFPNNVKQELIDFNKDFSLKPADHFFICLGYPLELLDLIYMRDKIKPKFEEVDFGLVIKLAKMALDIGIKDISVISSVMADKNSLNHYLKIKGEMEEEIKKLSFNKINIFRPSHLLGERENKIGLDVQIFEKVTNIFGQVLPSQLKDFKNVEARTLAKNMVTEAFNNKTGVSYFSHKDFN
jgi:nucleoside-diphosphate-sugar epimerase|tara:strand:- start:99 stop:743 length:645 start_codon:yes stop_codon:yes gene_type:complete